MSELPKGWVEIAISDVFDVRDGTHDSPKYQEDGFPLVTSKNIKGGLLNLDNVNFISEKDYIEINKRSRVDVNDLLFSMIGTIGSSYLVVEQPNWAIKNIALFKPKYGIGSKFLKAYLMSPQVVNRMLKEAKGTTQKFVGLGYLRSFNFPLPPLAEQERIVEKLDALFASLDVIKDKLDRIPELLKNFRQQVLTQAVTGKLLNTKFANKINVGDVTESSFYGPRFSKELYDPSGLATVRTSDMTEKGLIEITRETPRVVVEENKVDKFRVLKDDLLITRTGSVGKMAYYTGDEIVIPSAYLIRFRFKNNVRTKFIYYCLTSPYGQRIMGLNSTAITQPNLNAEKIKAIEIPDINIDVQDRIIARVEELFAIADRVEAQYTSLKEKVDQLPQAILAKAFRGELVEQDENDEPAEVLLERIMSESRIGMMTRKTQI